MPSQVQLRAKEAMAKAVQAAVERSMKAISEQNQILAEELAALSELIDVHA